MNSPEDTPQLVQVAPIFEGKPDVTKLSEIELESLGSRYRKQRLTFEAVRDVYDDSPYMERKQTGLDDPAD